MKTNLDTTFWQNFLTDSSRNLTDSASNLCCDRPDLFPSLLELIAENRGTKSQRASRTTSFAMLFFPELFNKYTPRILELLLQAEDDSIKFHLLRVFADGDFISDKKLTPKTEELFGHLMDFCFMAVESETKKVAIKVYAISILQKLTKIYPELEQELRLLITKFIEDAKPAFASRGRNILKQLDMK
jgi:hypothetical protein